jgi:hypothetical protein
VLWRQHLAVLGDTVFGFHMCHHHFCISKIAGLTKKSAGAQRSAVLPCSEAFHFLHEGWLSLPMYSQML